MMVGKECLGTRTTWRIDRPNEINRWRAKISTSSPFLSFQQTRNLWTYYKVYLRIQHPKLHEKRLESSKSHEDMLGSTRFTCLLPILSHFFTQLCLELLVAVEDLCPQTFVRRSSDGWERFHNEMGFNNNKWVRGVNPGFWNSALNHIWKAAIATVVNAVATRLKTLDALLVNVSRMTVYC